jgi:hypothetical protein
MAHTSTAACATPSKGHHEKTADRPGLSAALTAPAYAAKNALVLQTDFGTSDGAVSAMRGVAYGVDAGLTVADLTHNIPDYDIWVGGYRLFQTANYWPEGTVFVSVIDPGVGTTRKSVVLKTKAGRYFVGPDNGQFTLIAERDGVAELREIDERSTAWPAPASPTPSTAATCMPTSARAWPRAPSATSRSARCCRPNPW